MIMMLHTFFLWLYIALFMIFSITFYIPIGILSLPGLRKFRSPLIVFLSRNWAKMIVFLTGSKLEIIGAENFPQDHSYCVISNHQGSLDIPVIMSVVPWQIAFIAKKELRKLPIIGWWMTTIGVIFLDRSSRRHAVEVINKAAERVKSGHPMVIFPEGTRSKGGPVKEFKKGSLKLAMKAECKIVPISLDGTWKVLEENKGKFKGARIKVTVHPPVDIAALTDAQKESLAGDLQKMIAAPVAVQQ